jgi:hypothetical protein
MYNLNPEQQIKKIFVFTDMQFDEASSGKYTGTSHDIVKKMFNEKGYALPKIIFWNLKETHVSFPVNRNTPGVALMNGFSSEMLKLFLDDIEMTPELMMKKAVEKYNVKLCGETLE